MRWRQKNISLDCLTQRPNYISEVTHFLCKCTSVCTRTLSHTFKNLWSIRHNKDSLNVYHPWRFVGSRVTTICADVRHQQINKYFHMSMPMKGGVTLNPRSRVGGHLPLATFMAGYCSELMLLLWIFPTLLFVYRNNSTRPFHSQIPLGKIGFFFTVWVNFLQRNSFIFIFFSSYFLKVK